MKRLTLLFITIPLVSCAVVDKEPSETLAPIGLSSFVDITTTTETPTTSTTTTTEAPETTTTTEPIDFAGLAASWQLGVEEARAIYGKCGEWHDLAISVGFTEEDWLTLSAIIYRESRCQPDAWNGHDAGLTQINQIHQQWVEESGWKFPDDLFNPENSLRFTLMLKNSSGWRPWSVPSK